MLFFPDLFRSPLNRIPFPRSGWNWWRKPSIVAKWAMRKESPKKWVFWQFGKVSYAKKAPKKLVRLQGGEVSYEERVSKKLVMRQCGEVSHEEKAPKKQVVEWVVRKEPPKKWVFWQCGVMRKEPHNKWVLRQFCGVSKGNWAPKKWVMH